MLIYLLYINETTINIKSQEAVQIPAKTTQVPAQIMPQMTGKPPSEIMTHKCPK